MTLPTKPGPGIYRKYLVKRLRDREKKHANCEYFVLDMMHDPFAIQALNAYANACEATLPELASDLRTKVAAMHGRGLHMSLLFSEAAQAPGQEKR